ncbi:hypothetical protein D9M71_133210 [compost metagenome]
MRDQLVIGGEQVIEVLFAGHAFLLAEGFFVPAQVESQADATKTGDVLGPGQIALLAAAPTVHKENARYFGARAEDSAGNELVVDLNVDRFAMDGHRAALWRIC